MMNEIITIAEQVLDIAGEMSPYLLLGFLLAGLMHAFIPSTMYSRYLANGDFRSVLYAAMFGVPLPLCSCGVIPTAMSLRREGASKGATVSFLIATPQTGVDSIIATYSLLGLPYAIVRPVAALVTALLGGSLANWSEMRSDDGKEDALRESVTPTAQGGKSAAHDGKQTGGKGIVSKVLEALRYGFVDMMQDIGKWLMMGLVVAGLITALVPDSFFEVFKGNTLLSMMLVLAIAIPMYVCATGSIPIAVALMMKGLTPGSALVLLMAGPACNVASMLVVGKVLGRRTLATYLCSIVAGSVLFGVMIDSLLPAAWFVPTLQSAACCHHGGMSWVNIACTTLLGLLLLNALVQHYRRPHCHCHDEAECPALRTEFVVKGMHCNHCRASVLKALSALPGTKEVDVDLATGKGYIEGEVALEEVSAAVEGLGFECEKA